jgi:SAM-dependent methyltransferase
MHETSIALFRSRALPCFVSGSKVLEMGPDGAPSTYSRLLEEAGLSVEWHYADGCTGGGQDSRRVPMISLYEMDCDSEQFDVVFHGQVLEHVAKIWRWVSETARVLKTGGRMIVINPAAWQFHECPIDCWRAYPDGMRALLEDSGVRCDFSAHYEYADGTADTIAIGTKVSQPLISVSQP